MNSFTGLINGLLEGQSGSHIFPFFWLHGEEEPLLRKYVNVIHSSGIREMCVEARGHKDFGGETWWQALDAILDEAQKLDMKMWLLDDSHFPTGFANGAVLKNKEKGKLYINYSAADVVGPVTDIEIPVAALGQNLFFGSRELAFGRPVEAETSFKDDTVIAVIAVRLSKEDSGSEYMDLTGKVTDGKLFWDVPQGVWRFYVVYETRNYGGKPGFINLLDRESVQLLIDAVYEPHYERYGHLFGSTFVGFFSDEPGVGNLPGYAADVLPGKREMPLPWGKDMHVQLEKYLGADWKASLPMLWHPSDDEPASAKTRFAFMDAVSKLVSENFSRSLGNWCRERGVLYTGHIIEDRGCHTRLGCSIPHFFRAQAGQDVAGIDCIGGQVVPGAPYTARHGLTVNHGLFNHFALGKLAASAARIDPLKKERSMCEIFGAYGWDFGVGKMQWLLDHFLVRGVNKYVPHAFNPKEFPDVEAPPHFYAHGNNMQFEWFGYLMRYTNRVCSLLDGAVNQATVAILYNAESEWAGEYMPIEEPGRALAESQIDYHFVPIDALGLTPDGKLTVNGLSYRALVVPYSQYVTEQFAYFLNQASQEKYPVFFVDAAPDGVLGQAELGPGQAVPLAELAGSLKGIGAAEISVDKPFAGLRYGHWVRGDGGEVWMFFNESGAEAFDGEIAMPELHGPIGYNAYENHVCHVDYNKGILRLYLEPGESALILSGSNVEIPDTGKYAELPVASIMDLSRDWDVALIAPSGERRINKLETLTNIGRQETHFSGRLEYGKKLELPQCNGFRLTISECHDGVAVLLDGEMIGMRCAAPFIFEYRQPLGAGPHSIQIATATTPHRHVVGLGRPPNFFAPPKAMLPVGIQGTVMLELF